EVHRRWQAVWAGRQTVPALQHAEVVVVGVVFHHQDDDVLDQRKTIAANRHRRIRAAILIDSEPGKPPPGSCHLDSVQHPHSVSDRACAPIMTSADYRAMTDIKNLDRPVTAAQLALHTGWTMAVLYSAVPRPAPEGLPTVHELSEAERRVVELDRLQ